MFRLAHLSDLHATPPRFPWGRELTAKRALGFASWRLRRRKEHRARVLDALLEDLAAVSPDHVAITGDLTNLGLAGEIDAALPWLERLGGAGRVSLVPGNHDAYGPGARDLALERWGDYVRSTGGVAGPAPVGDFPMVRVDRGVALVGVSSAERTAFGLATGSVGADQLARLEEALGKLAVAGMCRVVLIHHPPAEGISPRRALTDAPELRSVLARAGAELVLHGHMHRRSVGSVPGPQGAIPVIGVPSSSALGRKPGRRAQYHVYAIDRADPEAGRPFRVSVEVRGLDPATGRFVAQGAETL